MMNILVLCTGNSARSILLEVLLADLGAGRVQTFSAGSHPAGKVHPQALQLLSSKGVDPNGLSSKSWDLFSAPGAAPMDIVITVCGNAEQVCPVWPGAPVRGHWGLPDPAAAPEADQTAAFAATWDALRDRAQRLLDLPIETMPREALSAALARIGEN